MAEAEGDPNAPRVVLFDCDEALAGTKHGLIMSAPMDWTVEELCGKFLIYWLMQAATLFVHSGRAEAGTTTNLPQGRARHPACTGRRRYGKVRAGRDRAPRACDGHRLRQRSQPPVPAGLSHWRCGPSPSALYMYGK